MWKDLTMSEKAALIKLGVNNGIINLRDIRDSYNQYKDGGYKPSAKIKKQISTWEGASMTTNRPFDVEAEGFKRVLPQGALGKLSQQQLDALFSYSYNVGSGNFKKRTSPILQRYINGKASIKDVQNSMWAAGDSKFKGLAKRRAIERAMFGNSQTVKPITAVEAPKVPKINTKTNDINLFPIGNAIVPDTELTVKNPVEVPINTQIAPIGITNYLSELQPIDIISMIPKPQKLNIRI